MKGKDLLSIADLAPADVWHLLHRAEALKGDSSKPLAGRVLALVFEKPSLRTRVSFEVAMHQAGGHSLFLSPAEVGLNQREAVADVARVLSRYVQGIVLRTFGQNLIQEMARYASVPVINGLSDYEHPCQALADLLTLYQKRGKLAGLTLCYIGDGNNCARSLLLACALVGVNFRMAAPAGYEMEADTIKRARSYTLVSGAELYFCRQPEEAVRGADAIYTDVWTSIGQEAESERRRRDFAGYRVDRALLSLAQEEVLIMHPLPAHRGQEIAPEVLDGPHSVIFDQAENRLHLQKAVLVELLGVK